MMSLRAAGSMIRLRGASVLTLISLVRGSPFTVRCWLSNSSRIRTMARSGAPFVCRSGRSSTDSKRLDGPRRYRQAMLAEPLIGQRVDQPNRWSQKPPPPLRVQPWLRHLGCVLMMRERISSHQKGISVGNTVGKHLQPFACLAGQSSTQCQILRCSLFNPIAQSGACVATFFLALSAASFAWQQSHQR